MDGVGKLGTLVDGVHVLELVVLLVVPLQLVVGQFVVEQWVVGQFVVALLVVGQLVLGKCLLSGIDTTLTVSTMLNGEYGIDDVCLSLLNVVGDKGAHAKIMLPLNEEEQAKLHNSAKVLKDLMAGLDI